MFQYRVLVYCEYAKQATAAQRLPREVSALLYRSDRDVDMVDAQRRIVYDELSKSDSIEQFKAFKLSCRIHDVFSCFLPL